MLRRRSDRPKKRDGVRTKPENAMREIEDSRAGAGWKEGGAAPVQR
jgi:hypothetical protein